MSDDLSGELCADNYGTEQLWTLTWHLFYLEQVRAPVCWWLGFTQGVNIYTWLHTIRAQLETQETCEGYIYWIRKLNSPNELRLLAQHIEPNFSGAELPSDPLCVFSSPLTASRWLRSTRLYTRVTLNPSPDHLRSEAAFRQTLSLHENTQPPHSFQWDGCTGTAGCWPHHPTHAAVAQHTRTFPGTSLCNLNRVIRLLTSQEMENKMA